MRALSIRQPYAELILRGIKTVEYRTRPTRIVGERFYIYASEAKAAGPIWSDDLRVATPDLRSALGWMFELAEQVGMIESGALLPTGVILRQAQDRQRGDEGGWIRGWSSSRWGCPAMPRNPGPMSPP